MRAWDALRRPIWLFDPASLRGLYANRAALALWGAASLEELLARDFSALSPAVRARTQRLAQATAQGEEVNEQWTFYPHGRPVTVEATISTYREAGVPAALLFEAAPSDAQPDDRRAAEALRHTATLITLFDTAGLAIFANPAAFAAYGAPSHPFLARFADPARGAALLARAAAGETASDLCEALTTEGRRWHHMQVRPVLDPVTGAEIVLLDERDVTARVEAERARAAAEQQAAMAQARQAFLSEMSHELRTPLNAVIGFSALLEAAGLPAAQADHAHRIHTAGARLSEVVDQMIQVLDAPITPPSPPSVAPAPGTALAAISAPQADAASDPGRPLRILYVDDNEPNRALVAAILASQGVDLATANDGAQGLVAAAGGGWDLILMDIQMPVMDGVEATRAIRRLPGGAGAVPIVAVTANTLPEQLESYEQAGMNDCLPKPLRMLELLATVARWVDEDQRSSVAA